MGCHFFFQGIFPTQGSNPHLLPLAGRFFTTEPPAKPCMTQEKKESEVAHSRLTLCNPVDCNLPGSSVHRISPARVLEWVAISFSRGSSRPRDRTCASCIGRQVLYHWATREALYDTRSTHLKKKKKGVGGETRLNTTILFLQAVMQPQPRDETSLTQ